MAEVYRPTPAHHSNTPLYVNAVPEISQSVNQQFQAPFIPSINLENTQSTHNGWSVVTPSTFFSNSNLNQPQQQALQSESKNNNNNINRISASLSNVNGTVVQAETDNSSSESQSIEDSTKRFDIDSFKPDFQSGFKPIYKTSAEQRLEQKSSIESKQPIETKSSDEISDRSDISLESLIYDDEEDIL